MSTNNMKTIEPTECSNDTYDLPWEIKDWLHFPYKFFSDTYGSKNYTLLDIACGENHQLPILEARYGRVISGDHNPNEFKKVEKIDILDLPKDLPEIDVIYSFETIEHVEKYTHLKMVNDLYKKANKVLILGTVNETGPTHIGPHEVWKNGLNPWHVAEYSTNAWGEFFINNFSAMKPKFYSSMYKGGGQWEMVPKLELNSASNYVVFEK